MSDDWFKALAVQIFNSFIAIGTSAKRTRDELEAALRKAYSAGEKAGSERKSDPVAKQATWTKTLPTVVGWYWWRDDITRLVIIRKVSNWPGGGLAVFDWRLARNPDGVTTPEVVGGEWCGPLEVPGGAAGL